MMLWDLRPQTWQASACSMAQRNLTQSEWEQFVSNEPYQQLCPQFSLHPSLVVKKLQDARDTADRATASTAFKQAVQLALHMDDPLVSDMVCSSGASEGFAADGLPACNHAVQLAPENGAYYDSRGLAKAISGDTNGAIQDLETFVSWYRANASYTRGSGNQSYDQERENWIATLKAGKINSFKGAGFLSVLSQEKNYTPEVWTNY